MKSDQPKQGDTPHPAPHYQPEFYEIRVQGQLNSLWEQWFEGMVLSSVENVESGVACTLIAGKVADQPALHGLLIKIRDLNLKLLSVRRILPGSNTAEEIYNKSEPSEEQND